MDEKELMLECLFALHNENVEGNKFHYNKGEKDITSPLGIYRGSNPDAEIFLEVEKKYKELTGKEKQTKDFDKSDIEFINKEYSDSIDFYNSIMSKSADFYIKYLGKIKLSTFPGIFRYPFFNIFINSKKIAVKALQMTYCEVKGLEEDKKTCDGIYGKATQEMIDYFKEKASQSLHKDSDILYVSLFLKNAIRCYVDISTDNGREDAQLLNLRGWVNRVQNVYKYVFTNY